MSKSSIPVTIITGFLGAGKTTLLNNLIAQHPEKKFAIIENEFGDIGIDQELVVNASEGIFEMSNGCICCSLNVELGQLLKKLVSDNYDFNHLIIETTGIAEPDGIAAAFIGDNRSSVFHLDGTVCLVDAQNISASLHERGESVKQVSFADVLVLNKTDLISAEELANAKSAIRQHNADAPVFECEYGKVAQPLLSLKAYESQLLENKLLNPLHTVRDHHDHHDGLTSLSFEYSRPFVAKKFEHWVSMLLFLSGYQIYRIKGIVELEGEARKIVFQSVRSNSKIEVGSEWRPGEVRRSKLVFIGDNLQRAHLERGLKSCLAQ